MRTGRLIIALAIVTGCALVVWLSIPAIPQIDPPPISYSSDVPMRAFGGSAVDFQEMEAAYAREFKEEPISSVNYPYAEGYRLILMPTFHAPILVEASRSVNGSELKTKRLSGKGGYDHGKLVFTDRRPLTDEEWRTLLRLVDSADLRWIPSVDLNDEPVMDGAIWIVQMRLGGSYHTAFRITPTRQYMDLCEYFLTLSSSHEDYEGYYAVSDPRYIELEQSRIDEFPFSSISPRR